MHADYRAILRNELVRRTAGNRSYSLRAFARALDLDVATLSRVFARKKILSQKAAERIVGCLALAPETRAAFLSSVAAEHAVRPEGASARAPDQVQPATSTVEMEAFRIIGDWYHYAILELSLTEGFRSDIRWIAKALGISALEAKLAVERLLDLGLLSDFAGIWRKTERNITTADKSKTTSAHRAHQAQMLDKAKTSIESDPFETRSMTGMTMAIDPAKLPEARAMIEDFMARLSAMLESGAQKQVYQLAVNLFPLQHKGTSRE